MKDISMDEDGVSIDTLQLQLCFLSCHCYDAAFLVMRCHVIGSFIRENKQICSWENRKELQTDRRLPRQLETHNNNVSMWINGST